jgi:hypothetical protein
VAAREAAAAAGLAPTPDVEGMARRWIAALLPRLRELGAEPARSLLKACAEAHYEELAMDATVAGFRGDLPSFLDFLRAEWGWTINHDPVAGVVLVDEGRTTCVCPLVADGRGHDLGALCYCSEGFAERMFSGVTGVPVRATVTASILRGDPSCVYRIELGGVRGEAGGA